MVHISFWAYFSGNRCFARSAFPPGSDAFLSRLAAPAVKYIDPGTPLPTDKTLSFPGRSLPSHPYNMQLRFRHPSAAPAGTDSDKPSLRCLGSHAEKNLPCSPPRRTGRGAGDRTLVSNNPSDR